VFRVSITLANNLKATAFAPGHISAFFEPYYDLKNIERCGSRGAGINISLGAISEVTASKSSKQMIKIYVNGRESEATVTRLALKHLIGDSPLKIAVKTKLELPEGQGFGMSGASSLSATYALASILGLSKIDAVKAAHSAEVELRTGLSDVVASAFGGVEVRKRPGLPPWGLIEHIVGDYDIVLCVLGEKIETRKILNDEEKMDSIRNYGRYCTKKLLENPSIENMIKLSKYFAEKTGLAGNKIKEAINAASFYGLAGMCMLGNSVFAIGETNKLKNILSTFGKVYVCSIDQCGARILKRS
jgi:pantoate kinase